MNRYISIVLSVIGYALMAYGIYIPLSIIVLHRATGIGIVRVSIPPELQQFMQSIITLADLTTMLNVVAAIAFLFPIFYIGSVFRRAASVSEKEMSANKMRFFGAGIFILLLCIIFLSGAMNGNVVQILPNTVMLSSFLNAIVFAIVLWGLAKGGSELIKTAENN